MRNQKTADVPDPLSLRNQHLIAVLFLLLVPVFLSHETILGDKQFFAHDTIQWRAGAESVLSHKESTGDEALWAHNMFAGMPAFLISYSRAVPLVDNLINAGLSAVFPAGPYWVLLFGGYVLFWLMGARPFTAAAGAVSLALTSYLPIIIGAGHNTKFQAFAYIPWLVVAYVLFRKRNNDLLAAAGLALALNLELRASHPQITYYFGLLLAGWWISDTVTAFRSKEGAAWTKRTLYFLVPAAVLALTANIQPYWSISEYSPYSIRGGSAAAGTQGAGLDLDYAFAWSQGWFELLTLIVPGIMGGSSATGYWGPKSVTSGPHYLGVIVFLFAAAGYWMSKRNEKHVFLAAGLAAILLSLGENFLLLNTLMFEYFPLFNKFRTPEMWLVVTVFCGSVLMVFGIEATLESLHEKGAGWRTLLPHISGFVVLIGLFFGAQSSFTFTKEGEVDQIAQQVASQYGRTPTDRQLRAQIAQVIQKQYVPQRKEVAVKDTGRALLYGFLALAVAFLVWKNLIPAFWLAPVLLLLTTADLLTVGRRYMALDRLVANSYTYESWFEQQRTPVIDFVQKNVASGDDWNYRVLPLDDNPFNNAVPSYFYPSAGGYSGAKLSIYQDVLNEAFYTEEGLNRGLLNMLNVKYIPMVSGQEIPGYNTVFRSEKEGIVLENSSVLPKAWFVDSVFAVATPQNALETLKTLDPAKAAFVSGVTTPSVEKDSLSKIIVVSYAPRQIALKVNRNTPGFLVLSELFYPAGWKAYVSGNEVPIHQTNYLLRGIEIPAGSHSVSFVFDPASHRISTLISWIANVVMLVLAAGAVVYSRRG